jgi:hypothetical protein
MQGSYTFIYKMEAISDFQYLAMIRHQKYSAILGETVCDDYEIIGRRQIHHVVVK